MKSAINLVHSDAQAVLRGRTGILDALREKHLFITGGTGFLGTWLLELLKVLNDDKNFNIRVTVFSRHASDLGKRWPHLAHSSWLELQEGDIRYLNQIPQDANFIIHAAALTDRRLFASQPSSVADTNVVGTARVLKASLLLENLERFLLVSSGLVYGGQPWEKPEIDEGFMGTLRCDDVNSIYAESKRMAEIFAHAAISENKLPLAVVRPFAFVGPYQSLELPWAVNDFIRDSLNGGPIRIMGDGATIRSLMYASDYAYAVLAALAAGKDRATYNIGSSVPVDLLTLAQMITRYFAPVPEIRTGLGQTGHDRTRLVPDTKKLNRDLGFTATVPLEEALQKTIEWHRKIRAAS